MTRTETRTVSPGRISGRSVFICSWASCLRASSIVNVIVTGSVDHSSSRLGLPKAIDDRHVGDAEVLRELADGQSGLPHPLDLRGGRPALGTACRPHPHTGV